MRISEAKVKYILQTILKEFECDICHDSCFYDFDSIPEVWTKITELITKEINEPVDSQYYKRKNKYAEQLYLTQLKDYR